MLRLNEEEQRKFNMIFVSQTTLDRCRHKIARNHNYARFYKNSLSG